MRTNFFDRAPVLSACVAVLISVGCGGGSASSGGGSTSSGGGSTPSGDTKYTVSGTLAGLGTGQSVSLQDNGGDTLVLGANGVFSFSTSLDSGSAYAVTVQSHTPGTACSISNGGGTVGYSNVTGIAIACAVGSEKILYSFGASTTDGGVPNGPLVMDGLGNLYGTTVDGGANGLYDGTVFKITPAGTETILHSFGASASDGQVPSGGLVIDSLGNLYGTTEFGGASNEGTVYRISAAGTETILYAFGASGDGALPSAGLVMDSAGNLYGTTFTAGANGGGTVYKISPAGIETVLYSFNATGADGTNPDGGLIMDSAGNLYGTTLHGGLDNDQGLGNGTVFEISAKGTETILYAISASFSGQYPEAGLAMDSTGNLYGTTISGGADGQGTAFEIGADRTATLLYAFGASSTDGAVPIAGLVLDSLGNLYGTTVNGGANEMSIPGDGTIYKIVKTATASTETLLYSFGASPSDGTGPAAGLIVDSVGNLYGTTIRGGANGKGTIFVIN